MWVMIEIFNRYGFFGTIRLIFGVLISKIVVSKDVKVVRYPFYIRGSRNIKWGKNFNSGVNLRIDADPIDCKSKKTVLFIGDHVQVNDYVHIGAVDEVIIGNNVLIASKVYISDHNHGFYNGEIQSSPEEVPEKRPIQSQRVHIYDNVWIGENVSVLPGTTIGRGSIIGANSVVSKDIPANCIAVGIPARVIKIYNFSNNTWEKV